MVVVEAQTFSASENVCFQIKSSTNDLNVANHRNVLKRIKKQKTGKFKNHLTFRKLAAEHLVAILEAKTLRSTTIQR